MSKTSMISFILPAFLFLISTLLSISPGRNNFISISTAMAQSTPTISRILVSGNQKVEADAIKMELSQKEGETLDQEKVSGDIKKIFNMGFFKDVRVSLLTIDNGQKILTYIVEEKPSINKIEYVGNDELTEDDIKDVVDLKQFSILNILKLEENVKKIQTLYVEKGYFLAQVSYQIQDQTNNQVDIKFIVNEHAKVTIRNILFIGNKKVKDNTLKEFMLTKEGNLFSFLTSDGNYKEEYLAADVELIKKYYYDHGFVNIRVQAPKVYLGPDKKHITITISLAEGKQYNLGKLDFSGDLPAKHDVYTTLDSQRITNKKDLNSLLTIKSEELFNLSKMNGDIARLSNIYRDQGYAYVTITPIHQVEEKKNIIHLTFDIQKGKKVYFEKILAKGNDKTRDKVIRRELRIYEGELYSSSGLQESKRRINALGFFESVDIITEPGSSPDKIIALVKVKERSTGAFQIGFGFSSVENIIGQAQISQHNLLGRGQTLSLTAQISNLRQFFDLHFTEPYLLDTDWSFTMDLFNIMHVYEDYVRNSLGGSFGFGYPFWDDWRIYLTYTIEEISVETGKYGRSGRRIKNLFTDGKTSSLTGSLSWDTRDNRLFPSRGHHYILSMEWADNILGSENIFTRMNCISRWYIPLVWKFVFKVNSQFGYIFSDDNLGIPIFERFVAGGIGLTTNLRGYYLRSISPTMPSPNNGYDVYSRISPFKKGGNKELIFNFEIEFPIFEKVGIRGVLFFDAGNVYDEDENLFYLGEKTLPAHLRQDFNWDPHQELPLGLFLSAGFGFRWFSPIGPLRFEWGIPLTPRPSDQNMLFEFTIGNSF